MKKSVLLSLFVGIFVFLSVLSFVSATGCDMSIKLINQDPYPAIPGDYVKLVFELSGVGSPNCQGSVFEIAPEYPFSSDPGQALSVDVNEISFINNYKQTVLVPYKLRVDKDAVDGDSNVKTKLTIGSSDTSKYSFDNFNVSVKDVRANFDVILNDYSYTTNNFVIGLINVGKNDAESLVVSIPEQDNIKVVGASEKVIGSLASNDDTTVSFNAIPKAGPINITLSYNDKTNTRRTIDAQIVFQSGAFDSTKASTGKSTTYYFVIAVIVLIIAYLIYRRFKKSKKKKDLF